MISAAPALKDEPKKAADLTGEWVVESYVWNGQPRPQNQTAMRFGFGADGSWTIYRGDRKVNGNRGYRTEPDADPPRVTLKLEPDLQVGRECLGIYRREGDTLTLCHAQMGDERPTTFASPPDSRITLMVFKRVKPKD